MVWKFIKRQRYEYLDDVHVGRMYIDEVLIRIFQNYEDEGVAYLNSKPMLVYMSIFDGSNWATRGGLDKIDWANSPFQVLYSNFILDACQVDPSNVYASPCANPAHSKTCTQRSPNLIIHVKWFHFGTNVNTIFVVLAKFWSLLHRCPKLSQSKDLD